MSKYKTTITSMALHLENESPIFGVNSVSVELDDEAAGIFLVIKDGDSGMVKIDIEQWDGLTAIVKKLKSQKCEGM